ncbi:unnamed protein product [Oikopleura dioica]|uniref:Uncharacterized protein n=1 Tax=Oikopleura dioica TaxID=34765 RepID=E4X139_OIKDI|nr:unnamed protein product [Oikopleura dioica]
MGSVNADNTVICLGTGSIQCKDDSVALDRSAAQLNYEEMLALLKKKKQSTKVAPFKPVRTYSLPGLKSAFLASFAVDTPGLTFPSKYLSPEGKKTEIEKVLSSPKSGLCKLSTKHIIFVITKSEENKNKLKASFQSDGQLFVGSFEVIFVSGKEGGTVSNAGELMVTDISDDYDGFETAALLAALNYLRENCQSETLESVTILRDTMRLNVRRLFREILGPGLKINDLVCLEAIDEPSLPDFFDRSSFIWGANWPNPNLALPATCSSLAFSLSSKTAELLVQKYSQLPPFQVHNSVKFLTGIMRHLISVKNITELSISRIDPSLRVQGISREPIIDNDSFIIS